MAIINFDPCDQNYFLMFIQKNIKNCKIFIKEVIKIEFFHF